MDPLSLALAVTIGLQTGMIVTSRYYRHQREAYDAERRQYQTRIDHLEHDLRQVRRIEP